MHADAKIITLVIRLTGGALSAGKLNPRLLDLLADPSITFVGSMVSADLKKLGSDFDAGTQLYAIAYADGDDEDLSEKELLPLLKKKKTKTNKLNLRNDPPPRSQRTSQWPDPVGFHQIPLDPASIRTAVRFGWIPLDPVGVRWIRSDSVDFALCA